MKTIAAFLILAGTVIAADIERLADDALKAWNAPGVAVVIVKDGEATLIARGVREAGKTDALTVDDIFPLASCTKAVTATLIATLADQGKLQFDDPVRKYLPEFHLADPKADALVSVRDLLTHRTGVNGHDLLWYRSSLDRNEIIRRIGKLPLSEPFRGAYQYSTLMYMAAGQAAANAAGTTLEDAVRTRITAPLGMTSVTFTTQDPAFLKATKAGGHRINKDGKLEPMPRYEVTEPNPAGSINLSPRDMVPWLKMLLNDRSANLAVTQSPQIPIPLSPAAKRFHPETVQLSYGMGWIISDYRGLKVLSHGGMIDGFRTLVVLVPEKRLAFALFSNLHDSKMVLALGNSIIDQQLKLEPRDWNAIFLKAVAEEKTERKAAWERLLAEKPKLRPRALELEKYSGVFHHPAYGDFAVGHKDGTLTMKWSTFESKLEYWGDDAFRICDGFLQDQFLEFAYENGVATALKFQNLIFRK